MNTTTECCLHPGSCHASYAFTCACQMMVMTCPRHHNRCLHANSRICPMHYPLFVTADDAVLQAQQLHVLPRLVTLWVSAQCTCSVAKAEHQQQQCSLQVWHQWEAWADDAEKLAGIVKVPLDLLPLTSGTPSEPAVVVAKGMRIPWSLSYFKPVCRSLHSP